LCVLCTPFYLVPQDLISPEDFFHACLALWLLIKNFCCARDFHFLRDFLVALFPVPKLVLSQFLSSSLGASFSPRYGTDFWSSCWVCSSDLFFSPAVLVSVKLSALEISCLVFSSCVPAVHFLKRQVFALSVFGLARSDLRFSLLFLVSSSILVPLVQQFTRTVFLPCLIWCLPPIRSYLAPRILTSRGRITDFVPACFSCSRVEPRQRFQLKPPLISRFLSRFFASRFQPICCFSSIASLHTGLTRFPLNLLRVKTSGIGSRLVFAAVWIVAG
jgi:hypothetical protein